MEFLVGIAAGAAIGYAVARMRYKPKAKSSGGDSRSPKPPVDRQ